MSDFEASLVCKASSRTTRAMKRNPVLNPTPQKKEKEGKSLASPSTPPSPLQPTFLTHYHLSLLTGVFGGLAASQEADCKDLPRTCFSTWAHNTIPTDFLSGSRMSHVIKKRGSGPARVERLGLLAAISLPK